jgi:cellulose biosynthesis protein BcsQ
MTVLATYNIKGGVGKTTAAVNLAVLAAREGARTLIWDLDPQGATTFFFRVKPKVKGGGKGLVKRKHEMNDLIKAPTMSILICCRPTFPTDTSISISATCASRRVP